MSEPDFPPPNLQDPAQLDAYRSELRGVARPIRAVGFVLCIAGVAAFFSPIVTGWWWLAGFSSVEVGLAITIVGWLLLIVAFIQRSLHHRRRMRGKIPGPA